MSTDTGCYFIPPKHTHTLTVHEHMLRARLSVTRRWVPLSETAPPQFALRPTRQGWQRLAPFHTARPDAVKFTAVYADAETTAHAAPVLPVDMVDMSGYGLLEAIFVIAHESLPGPHVPQSLHLVPRRYAIFFDSFPLDLLDRSVATVGLGLGIVGGGYTSGSLPSSPA